MPPFGDKNPLSRVIPENRTRADSRWQRPDLPWLSLALDFGEAIAAVDRPACPRLKRNLAFLAAGSADDAMHLPGPR